MKHEQDGAQSAPRRISPAQERYLLRRHFGELGGPPATCRALFALGMLGADARGNVIITPAGREYLDAWHRHINL